jgi:hypothetical protein
LLTRCPSARLALDLAGSITFARSARCGTSRRLQRARSIVRLRASADRPAHLARCRCVSERSRASAGGAAAASGRPRNRPCESRRRALSGPCGRARGLAQAAADAAADALLGCLAPAAGFILLSCILALDFTR